MPFWVVVEAWSISLASRYYGLLNRRHQQAIANRFGIGNTKVLEGWLRGFSDLRNRCARHSRIWNHASKNPLPMLRGDPFMDRWISRAAAMQRFYGASVVIARLMTTVGPNSKWFRGFGEMVDQKPDFPGFDFSALGLSGSTGFPHHLFKL